MEQEARVKKNPEKTKKEVPDTRKNLSELRNILANRAQIQLEIAQIVGNTIDSERFKGEKIQVLPDPKDKTTIYIKTSHAQIQLDLHYDETKEEVDSLRKNTKIYPEISITGEVDGELYEINGYDEEFSAKIAGELLKQIERKKNPEIFGYKEIRFSILDDNTIILAGKQKDGKIKRVGFFDFIDDERDRVMLYGYIAHYFGKPLDPKIFEKLENGENINPSTEKDHQWKSFI